MSTGSPEDQDNTFGSVNESDLDFGAPAMDLDAESSFSSGDFAERAAADEGDRIVPSHLFANPAQPAPNHNDMVLPVSPVNPVPPVAQTGPVNPVPPVGPVPPVSPVPPVNPVSSSSPVAPFSGSTTTGESLAFGPGSTNHNPTPAPTQHTAKSTKKTLIAAGAAGLTILLAGGAFAAYKFGVFGAVGPQPSDALPANTFAYASIDFNPSANQKVGAYQFAKNFPATNVSSAESLKQDILTSLFDDTSSITYDTNLEPWVGDRAAFAAIPAPGTDDGFTPLVVIEVTDQDAAAKNLDTIAELATTRPDFDPTDVLPVQPTTPEGNNPEPASTDSFAYAFRDGYVLISDNQTEVDAAAAETTTLTSNETFTRDMDALGGDQIARGWVNADGFVDAVPEEYLPELPTIAEQIQGSAAVGLHADGNYLELTGHVFNDTAQANTPTTLADKVPGDATIALAATGLGTMLADAWNAYAPSDIFGLQEQAASAGFNLPQDLETIFGTDFAAAAKINDDLTGKGFLTGKTTDPTAATTILDGLLSGAADEFNTEPDTNVEGDTYTATTDKSWDNKTPLTDNDAFNEAVAYTDGAAFLYVNIADIVTTTNPSAETDPNLAALKAVGLAAKSEPGHGTFTLRVTIN